MARKWSSEREDRVRRLYCSHFVASLAPLLAIAHLCSNSFRYVFQAFDCNDNARLSLAFLPPIQVLNIQTSLRLALLRTPFHGALKIGDVLGRGKEGGIGIILLARVEAQDLIGQNIEGGVRNCGCFKEYCLKVLEGMGGGGLEAVALAEREMKGFKSYQPFIKHPVH